MFLPKLAKALGSCERAIILQQIHWLSNQPHSGKDIDGEHWVWGTYEEWCRDYFSMWSPHTLRKHIHRLEVDGVLISAQLRAHEHDQTKYYRLKYDHEYLTDTGMRPYPVVSNRPDMDASNRPDAVASNRPDAVASSITESSTKSSAENSAPLTPQQELFAAVCEALGWDYNIVAHKDKQKVAEAVTFLDKASYTTEDVRRFMLEIWFHDWRWEQHQQRPTLNQLRQEIGKLRAVLPENAKRKKPTSKVERSLSAVDEYFSRKANLEQSNELGGSKEETES
jgi:hypothetical protein